MEKISLRLATKNDSSVVVAIDYALNKEEHIKLKREEKIIKAISDKECFVVLANNTTIGFVIFNYSFFDQGWIDLIILEKKYRNKGIGKKVFELICKDSQTNKVFTSTNNSNIQMQKSLTNAGFTFAGKLNGLDDGDPELFYYKKREKNVEQDEPNINNKK